MADTLYDSYFRPWGPKFKESMQTSENSVCGLTATKIDSVALDLSQKQQSVTLRSPDYKSKSMNKAEQLEKSSSSINKVGASLETLAWNPLYYTNPLLLQQIQAYYHFINSFPLLQQQQMQLFDEGVAKNQTKCNAVLQADSTSIQNFSKDLKMDSNLQRGILNIPSPTFSHSHHHKINVEEKSLKNDPTFSSQQYPLPAANDGEPLDLLPKSLYMNKAHGGHLCIFCGKLYSRKYGLKIHLRTHTGYKPLKCKVCQRPFGDPSNLNKHIRLHAEGETPYRCEHCGKVLVRRRDLERHIRSRHPDKVQDIVQLESPSKSEEDEFDCSDIDIAEELDVVG